MKLLRHGAPGAEKPGLFDADGKIRDLSTHVDDITGSVLNPEGLARLAAIDPTSLPVVDAGTRLGPCVGQIGKMACIGLNYTDHAEEMGMDLPTHPVLFMKANSAISGPNDDIVLPRGATKGDWEVELGIVVGTKAKYVSAEDALDHVAGYCIVNDVTERDFQSAMSGQWTKGKSCDTFGPTGPWLVTADEITDVQNLDLWCEVNGHRVQTGTTSRMIFSVAEIIEHLSHIFTLHPGDVISTGTPPGVGVGMNPQRFLAPGDIMTLGITGLGEQRQNVRQDS